MAFQCSLEIASTGGDIQQELLTLVAGAVKGGGESELEIQGDKQATTSESERAGLPEAGRAKGPFMNEISSVKVRWAIRFLT